MPGGGSEGDGSEDGGMPGEESPSGSEGSSSSSESGSPGGEVGSFPSEDPTGVPPPPSSAAGGAGEEGEESGSSDPGDGDSAGESEWEDEGGGESECGDTGALPGGVGGMGQAGECIGGGASSSSESESSSESSADGAEGGSQGTGGAGSVGEFPEESDAERAQRLGRELDESVGGFDEVLQEEQREIAAAGRNTEGFGEGTTGGDGGISLGQQSSGSGNPVAVANTSMSRESPTAGMSQEEIRERTPEDIPMMVDDDIIARQLREAALAENDPALRERLWEEYRKYSGL
jgi:hypothetical protein